MRARKTKERKPAGSSFSSGTVWTGNNLPVLRGRRGEYVDPVDLDPPFKSSRILGRRLAVRLRSTGEHYEFMPISRFLHQTCAGATAIVAAGVTVATLLSAALIIDHVWLLDQRDSLKSAANAAAIAATIRLQELPRSMSDDDVDADLLAVARRYVRFNLAANLREGARARMDETLDVQLTSNRTLGTVAVVASADLGGTLLSKRILAYAGPEDGMTVNAGAEGSIGATELVLAIDVTSSMLDNLDGVRVGSSDPTSRINIVRRAAVDLVDILAAFENSTIAVGIVPWNYRVRLNRATREQWEADGWAIYPSERTYPHPTRGPPGSDRFLPESQTMPNRSRLPAACRAWAGCVDMRVVDAALRPSFSNALPSDEPYVMNFFTDQTTYPEGQYVSYQCQAYTRAESNGRGGEEPLCYDLKEGNLCRSGDIRAGGPWRVSPQDDCRGPVVMPLNTDLAAVRNRLRRLSAGGSATYSSAGIAWAMHLLASSWRDVWGDSVHPMDADAGVQKVILLLTDGEDNHLGNSRAHRQQGCTAAKNQGITVFTIAAMHPDEVGGGLANELFETVPARDDDPDGTYFFANNATPDALREAFADIARQMIKLRRTY